MGFFPYFSGFSGFRLSPLQVGPSLREVRFNPPKPTKARKIRGKTRKETRKKTGGFVGFHPSRTANGNKNVFPILRFPLRNKAPLQIQRRRERDSRLNET